ncbi:hypothetical protein PG994_000529 [Apiospora phragmitis]|uniref:Rhodopsin domain-containing protein n=1 Tax=Apiospora phragmitis TaxID=2905665 RepID=A0ABR1X6Q2_9PEZI
MGEHGVMPLPEGQVQDFHRMTYIQILIVTVFSFTFTFATALLALRIYTSVRIVKHSDVSDREHSSIPFIALWDATTDTGSPTVLISLSHAIWIWEAPLNVTAEQLDGYNNYLLSISLTYIWPPTLAKLAILVLYRQVNPFQTFRICVYITTAAITIYTVVFTALLCGPCDPVDVGSGTCLNNIAIAQAILNILSDVWLIVLPIPMIHGLRMPLRQKIVVGVILGLGSAVVIASIARISSIRAVTTSPDVTWTQASACIWSSVELNFGIVCNCMARLRPFVRAHMPKLARQLDYHGDVVTPYLATMRSSHEPGPNEGGDGEAQRVGEEATDTLRLRGFEGNRQRGAQGESGHILVRNEVTVDVEQAEAASRRSSSESLIRC